MILVTLVGQGLTLGPLIERLGVSDDGVEEREERVARQQMAEAGIDAPGRARGAGLDQCRQRRPGARAARLPPPPLGSARRGRRDNLEERVDAWRRLQYELYDAQRHQLVEMRNRGEISDEVRRKIERDLDLEESRLEN